MTNVSVHDAKLNFEAMLDQAQHEPVCIQCQDRDVAVVISREEFETFRKLRAKDLIALTDEAGRYAESQGMTDELLARLLASRPPIT